MSGLASGTRLGPYEIVAPIGAGGMGEIFRARDTRLGRDVAIKVLPAQFASDPDRLRRFEHEARAVAALSHPNILAIYDVGSGTVSLRGAAGPEAIPPETPGLLRPAEAGLAVTGGGGATVHYIVTELLEGESLRDRLRSGGLTVRKAVETAIQIAQGLAAAHEKGIVHRDLKPANVFLTKDGQVKILDFGIAKLTRPDTGPQATTLTPEPSTKTGALLGTAGYMSPEQVRGLPTDHRTDIFSFGCVLYEMLSGRSPFHKDTTAETMTAILHEDPPPLVGLRKEIPPALEAILARCLEKRTEDRFTSAHDLALALHAASSQADSASTSRAAAPVHLALRRRPLIGLGLAGIGVLLVVGVTLVMSRRPGSQAGATRLPKIVVLPFENLSGPENSYFAAGMTEEITSRLANVKGLRVVSRTSAVEYDRKGKTVRQIGSDLSADFVLEGSVRCERGAGNASRVRIAPQLIRVADDTHIWADRYERVLQDVFAVQTEVAENVVRAMGVTLIPREQAVLKEVSTNDLRAYDFYLRGLELTNRSQNRQDQEGAIPMFQAAVDRDPRFEQALAQLARGHLMAYWLYLDRSGGHLESARDAVDRLASLGADLPETHIARGYYAYVSLMDFQRALAEFKSAFALQPSSNEALLGMGVSLRRLGRWGESAQQLKALVDLDPRNPKALWNYGETCVFLRQYQEADDALGAVLSISPQFALIWGYKARLQVAWRGDVEKARSVVSQAEKVPGLKDDFGGFAYARFEIDLMRRDYAAALRRLEADTGSAISWRWAFLPVELLRGEAWSLAGQRDAARLSFGEARRRLVELIRDQPNDARYYGSLGIASAGLGLRGEALNAAKRGVELMAAVGDVPDAQRRLWDLALVYAMLGEREEATDRLDSLLAASGWWTPNVLRLDPRWDPLRSNPGFQALLTKYAVKP